MTITTRSSNGGQSQGMQENRSLESSEPKYNDYKRQETGKVEGMENMCAETRAGDK